MKKTSGFWGAFWLFYCCARIGTVAADAPSALPFETAVIAYDLSGTQQGAETVYVDAAANRIAIERSVTVTVRGITDSDRTLDIYDGSVLYSVNLSRNTAVRTVRKGDAVRDLFMENRYTGYYKGETVYLDRPCRVYEFTGGTAYFWQGMLLKHEISAGPEMTLKKEAVRVSLNEPLPEEKFRLPRGVTVTDAGQLIETFEQNFKRESPRQTLH